MKTRLLLLVILIICFSCGTNNKPVSDAQKEKIKGEVKEVVSTFLKACEEVNPDMVIETRLNSPDFIMQSNGQFYNYQETNDVTKSFFSTLLNQQGMIIDENYAVLDNSTVMYTANSKWVMNFKDGHSVLQDPWAIQYLFQKIDNKWKIVTGYESGIEKNVPNESSNELNQVELMKQFIGTWKNIEKDTTYIWECKPFGEALKFTIKSEVRGITTIGAESILGYDKEKNMLIESVVFSDNPEIFLCPCWFTSKNSFTQISWKDLANPEKADLKWEIEFKSPDSFVINEVKNNELGKPFTYIRVK